jgi:hypothetical protein
MRGGVDRGIQRNQHPDSGNSLFYSFFIKISSGCTKQWIFIQLISSSASHNKRKIENKYKLFLTTFQISCFSISRRSVKENFRSVRWGGGEISFLSSGSTGASWGDARHESAGAGTSTICRNVRNLPKFREQAIFLNRARTEIELKNEHKDFSQKYRPFRTTWLRSMQACWPKLQLEGGTEF